MNSTAWKIAVVLLVVLGIRGPAAPAGRARAAEPARRSAQVKIPSRRDGIVLVIGMEIRKDEKIAAERVVAVKIGEEARKYRRLVDGDMVEVGQLLVQLDDRLAGHKVAIRRQQARSRDTEYRAAKALADVYQGEVDRLDKIVQTSGKDTVSQAEYATARSQAARSKLDAAAKKEAVEVAVLEMQQAELIRDLYQVRSPVRGVIRTILKNRGEAVRRWETVLIIEVAPRDQ
jgi:multidrug efflux pump subunit AcrA (membrane-fusion protein)